MFVPLSSQEELIDVIPESIVGRPNPLQNINYENRPVSSAQHALFGSLSDAVRQVLSNKVGFKGFTNSSPILSGTNEEKPMKQSDEIDDDTDIKQAITNFLHGTLDENVDAIAQPDHDDTKDETAAYFQNEAALGIHSLGSNNENVLRWDSEAVQAYEENAETQIVGSDNFIGPAQTALRQKAFDLSTVFDPSRAEDVDLFGLSKDEDSGEDEATFDDEKSLWRHDSDEDSDGNGLDAELDAVIGESYGIWDMMSLKKKDLRSSNKGKSKTEDAWATNDSMDVSDFHSLVPDMAIEYPFDLDAFQKRAVYRLERDESVFVAAHTSAGKTVVAEYAIALAMQRRTKVVYTSPIKTLSNQKFRDFTTRFGDVGIITGDISVNPDASCLVMTTEILRSMLYKGADLIRDLSHVIFDECHWLNDPERGVVWEESIILLPTAVNIVMLSATVPNAMEFASWVGKTKQRPIYVVHTAKRPVPLSHQIFVKGEVYPLFDSSQGKFLDANYRRAAAHHEESTKNANVRFGGGRNHAWMPIIKFLQKRNLDPAIFFCFSKKKCDEAADKLHTQNLTTSATDKNQIHLFYQAAIARLSVSDRGVPQIARHRDMLKRGIGVHHAGVLPIIKEITEVLFQKGLIRVLFATETFAMGVNMPARTVVFTGIRKFDSQGHRLLEPGEYVQMAGRAGRRGLDDVGTVLLFPSAADFPVQSDVKAVLTGKPKPLRSQFRLTYNMILNLLRIDELRVEDVMARSFSEAPAGRTSGTVKKLIEKGNEALDTMHSSAVELERYRDLYHLSRRVDALGKMIGKTLSSELKNSTKAALGAGRIVLVRGHDSTFRVGVIVKAPFAEKAKGLSIKGPKVAGSGGKEGGLVLKVLILCGGPATSGMSAPYFEHGLKTVDLKSRRKQYNSGGLIVEIGDVALEEVVAICAVTIEINERAIVPIRGEANAAALASTSQILKEIAVDSENWTGLPHLHPRRDLALHDVDVESLWNEREEVVKVMNSMIISMIRSGTIAQIGGAFEKLGKESSLEQKLSMLQIATSDESLQLMPDYRQRIEVLERLGYIEGTSVRLKGRAACEVNTCESIILTELVFEKILQGLEAWDLAALLSSLVFQERTEGAGQRERLREHEQLFDATGALVGVVTSLGDVQSECGMVTSGGEYARCVNFGFVEGVRAWACGSSFRQVCELGGEVSEGIIVRTIVRLCELLREAKNVGRVIGDPDLQRSAEQAMTLVRRDVIFAASLYIQ